MDELEKAAYRFMNQPINEKEKLEMILQCDIIQAIEDGFNGHDINRDEVLKDVNWLIEQALKVERYEKAFNCVKEVSINNLLNVWDAVTKDLGISDYEKEKGDCENEK